MRILFVVPSYKPAYIYGGPTVVIAMLAEQLVILGHEVAVYTTTANGKKELNVEAGKEILVEGVKVIYFKRLTGDHTHVSPALWNVLNNTVKKFDVVHIHSWWSALVIGAAWICKKNGVKPIVSPHGMFSKYILQTKNSSKKQWLHKFIGQRLLKSSWLHVSTEMEWEESQKIITNWEGKIIPNLVKLSQKVYRRAPNDVFTIGFLSRIDPKKGLDVLIAALAKVDFDYKLLIAGLGEEAYMKELKDLSMSFGNASKIQWLGWKNGEDKFSFLAGLDLFALTSHSENFAIVVIESLSVGTPVFISEQVGLYKYVQQNDYGWVTNMEVEKITKELNRAVTEKNKLERINKSVPEFIKNEYNELTLAREYVKLYQMINHNATSVIHQTLNK